jgi:hypothetical protein
MDPLATEVIQLASDLIPLSYRLYQGCRVINPIMYILSVTASHTILVSQIP